MLVIAITITLHPMGLAYPLALAWQWYRNPKSDKQQKQVWMGIGITSVIILAMQTGWIEIPWGNNPLVALHNASMGYDLREIYLNQWGAGAALMIPLLYLLYRDYKLLSQDLMGGMLLISVVIGLAAADQNWATIAVAILLYRGVPALIALNKKTAALGFLGQRGIVFVAILAISLLFMQADKFYATQLANHILTPREQLIQRLAKVAADKDKPFLAASQWPAQTMIVCKRDVLPLPPPQKNGEALLAIIKNITHIMFNHHDPDNHQLAKNIAELSGLTETVDIESAGVIVKIRHEAHENDAGTDGKTSAQGDNANSRQQNKDVTTAPQPDQPQPTKPAPDTDN
jgi:hypothetical protein